MPRCRWSVSRSLALVLGSFLLLGHACAVSAAADVVAHLHGTDHRSGDHATNEQQVTCDALVGLRSSTGSHLDPDGTVDAGAALPVAAISAAPPLVVVARQLESAARPRPLPLFLLYATLLI